MKFWNITKPQGHRFLASTVGAVFFFAVVAAQFGFCNCGVLCAHTAATQVSEPVEAPISCCPSEKSEAKPKPQPAEHDADTCPCLHLEAPDSGMMLGPVPAAPLVTKPQLFQFAPLAEVAVFIQASGLEVKTSNCPTRGSPLPRRSFNILNAVFII